MTGADEGEQPVGELFGRLIDEGKAYARAEAGLARARVEVQVDRAKRPLVLGGAALALGLAALVAFAVTLVIALASLLGPLGGGALATLLLALAAGLCAAMAKRSWERRP